MQRWPGEALVEVNAAGITFAELTWDLTWTTRDGLDRTPVIPSHEVSGVVRWLGENARPVYRSVGVRPDLARSERGRRRLRDSRGGRPGGPAVLGIPSQAASLPLAAPTAWQALTDHA